jgi:O-antigen/teichoic acid export membrane protein
MRMDLAVLGEVLSRLVTLASVGLVVATHGGLLKVVAALVSGTLAQFLFAWWVGRRFERFRPRLEPAVVLDMLRESGVLIVVTLLGLIHFKVDTLMLSVLRTDAEVGIYGVAYKVHEVLITFPGLFVGLLYPVFARLAREDRPRLWQVFQRAFDVLVVTSLGAALLVFVLAPDLAALLGARAAAHPMRILALALPPVFLALSFTHLVLAEARQRWLVPLYTVLVIANVGCNAVAIRRWSYDGAAGVTVLTESLALGLLAIYWVGRRGLRLRPRSLGALPMAVAIAVAAEAARGAWLSEPAAGAGLIMRLALLGLLVGGLYAALVLALRLLPQEALRAMLPASLAGASRHTT